MEWSKRKEELMYELQKELCKYDYMLWGFITVIPVVIISLLIVRNVMTRIYKESRIEVLDTADRVETIYTSVINQDKQLTLLKNDVNILVKDKKANNFKIFEDALDDSYNSAIKKIDKTINGANGLESYLCRKYEMISDTALMIVKRTITKDNLEEIVSTLESKRNYLETTVAPHLLSIKFINGTTEENKRQLDRFMISMTSIINRPTNNKKEDIKKLILDYTNETLHYTVFKWNEQKQSNLTLEEVLTLIEKDQLDTALNNVYNYTDKDEYILDGTRTEALLLLSRWNSLKKDNIMGVAKDYQSTKNELKVRLIDLINNIK